MSMDYKFSILIPNSSETIEHEGKHISNLDAHFLRFSQYLKRIDNSPRESRNKLISHDGDNRVTIEKKNENSLEFIINAVDREHARTYINTLTERLKIDDQKIFLGKIKEGAENAQAKQLATQILADFQNRIKEASGEPVNVGRDRSVTNSFEQHRSRPRANAISNPKQGISLDGVVDINPQLEPELDIEKLKRYYQEALQEEINNLNDELKAFKRNSNLISYEPFVEAGTAIFRMQNAKSDSPDNAIVAINKNFKAYARDVSPESIQMLELSAKAFLAARAKVLGPDAPPYEFTLTCENVEQGMQLKQKFEKAGIAIKDPIKYNTPQPQNTIEQMPKPMEDTNRLDDSAPRQRQRLTRSVQ